MFIKYFMKNAPLVKTGLLNSFLTVVYVSFVALLMSSAEKFFSNTPDSFISPVAILLLFVLSASVTGYLVIGRPLMLYFDNQKPAALKLFGLTLLFLFVFAIGAFLLNFVVR